MSNLFKNLHSHRDAIENLEDICRFVNIKKPIWYLYNLIDHLHWKKSGEKYNELYPAFKNIKGLPAKDQKTYLRVYDRVSRLSRAFYEDIINRNVWDDKEFGDHYLSGFSSVGRFITAGLCDFNESEITLMRDKSLDLLEWKIKSAKCVVAMSSFSMDVCSFPGVYIDNPRLMELLSERKKKGIKLLLSEINHAKDMSALDALDRSLYADRSCYSYIDPYSDLISSSLADRRAAIAA